MKKTRNTQQIIIKQQRFHASLLDVDVCQHVPSATLIE